MISLFQTIFGVVLHALYFGDRFRFLKNSFFVVNNLHMLYYLRCRGMGTCSVFPHRNRVPLTNQRKTLSRTGLPNTYAWNLSLFFYMPWTRNYRESQLSHIILRWIKSSGMSLVLSKNSKAKSNNDAIIGNEKMNPQHYSLVYSCVVLLQHQRHWRAVEIKSTHLSR